MTGKKRGNKKKQEVQEEKPQENVDETKVEEDTEGEVDQSQDENNQQTDIKQEENVEEEKKEEKVEETKEEEKVEDIKETKEEEQVKEEKKVEKTKVKKEKVQEEKPKIEEEEEEEEEKPVVKQSPPPQPTVVKQQPQQSPPPQQQPKPVSSGWGGWFSSVASAVSTTINNALTDVEPDPEPIIVDEKSTKKEDKEGEEEEGVDSEKNDETTDVSKAKGDDEDEVEGLLNVIDKSVFKTADLIADSLMFAGNLFSSGLKTVQDNAKMENVKGLAQDVANLSIETTRKATNSELYEKGQKIASQMMDSSVETLESVGQRAYTMFSETKKNMASNNQGNSTNSTTATTTTTTTGQQPSAVSPTSPKSPASTRSKTTSPSTLSSSTGESDEIDVENEIIFKDNEFDSAKCFDYFKVSPIQQEIERITIESTMKIHQFNRKLSKDVKPTVESTFAEIKDLIESEDFEMSEKPKSLTNSNESFELENKYNKYFDSIQEFIPKLGNQSHPTALCRGLEKMVHLTSLGLELINAIGQSGLSEKPENSDVDVKQWTLSKAKDYSYLINKIISDIKSISSILTEIIKAKQNPQTRKYLNTITIETNNTISNITDCRACFVAICSIMYINQSKNK